MFYPLCIIYIFSAALVATDMAGYILLVGKNSLWNNNNLFFTLSAIQMVGAETSLQYCMSVVLSLFSGCCKFMAQSILVHITHIYCSFYLSKFQKIYPCWFVWNHNIHVVIFPSILAITFLGQSTYFILTGRF